MRVLTILGTRPEIIRLSLIIKRLDIFAEKHVLVHTGQNYDKSLSEIFFEQLRIRKPDHTIVTKSHAFGQQVGVMLSEVEKIIQAEKPDKILVLGDTNSALCAILGARMNIPVYHMEAGNRCFDSLVPEETNRRIIDSISDFNLPYTETSRENLLREGIPAKRIWVSGNPIREVLDHYVEDISKSHILEKMDLKTEAYMLVTIHRAENVDNSVRLKNIFSGLDQISKETGMPVICSIHPRTKARLMQFGILEQNPNIHLHEPFGLFDFVKLEKNAKCVITDSGTVQEECCLFQVPTITVRQSTERPETVECGSNILAGLNPNHIANCVKLALAQPRHWKIPSGYDAQDVSFRVVHFILGGLSYV